MYRLSRGVVSVAVWTRISVLQAQVDPGIQACSYLSASQTQDVFNFLRLHLWGDAE
jgi:hypothetical protein